MRTDDETGEVIPNSEQCTLKRPLQNSFEISTIIFFVVPMTLILVLYLLIGIQLRKSEAMSRNTESAHYQQQQQHAAQQQHHHQVASNGKQRPSAPSIGAASAAVSAAQVATSPVASAAAANSASATNGATNGSGREAGGGSIVSKNGSCMKFTRGRRSWEGRHQAIHGRPSQSGSAPHSHSVSSRRAVIRMLSKLTIPQKDCDISIRRLRDAQKTSI